MKLPQGWEAFPSGLRLDKGEVMDDESQQQTRNLVTRVQLERLVMLIQNMHGRPSNPTINAILARAAQFARGENPAAAAFDMRRMWNLSGQPRQSPFMRAIHVLVTSIMDDPQGPLVEDMFKACLQHLAEALYPAVLNGARSGMHVHGLQVDEETEQAARAFILAGEEARAARFLYEVLAENMYEQLTA